MENYLGRMVLDMFDMYRVFYIWYGSRVLGFEEWSLCTILRSKDISRIRLVTMSNTSWYWTLVWHMLKKSIKCVKKWFFFFTSIFFETSFDTHMTLIQLNTFFLPSAIVIYNQRSIFIHCGTYNGSGRDTSWKVPSRMLCSKHLGQQPCKDIILNQYYILNIIWRVNSKITDVS